MDISQLLHAFPFTPNRKIVVANLPEIRRTDRLQLAGGDLFQHLNRDRKSLAFRFADEQMYVLGHYYVSCDVAAVPTAHALEFSLECLARNHRIEEWHPAITTECDEVQATLLLVRLDFGPIAREF